MPRYKNERLTSWDQLGYMDFMRYPEFQQRYNIVKDENDRQLLTILYFTGARPGEVMEIKRNDIWLDESKIVFRIITLKREKTKIRLLDWPFIYVELQNLWAWLQKRHEGYIFDFVRVGTNPRKYICDRIGMPAYFFRHNLFSLMRLNGASRGQIKLFKGAQSEMSVAAYDHLSKEERDNIHKILPKAIE